MSSVPELDRAHAMAADYLERVSARHVGGSTDVSALRAALGGPLPDGPEEAVQVIDQLAAAADPGVVATVGPRYFGFVTGGAVPVTVAADWLASTWDQNGATYVMSPAVAVIEDIVTEWVLELLGLPATGSVGFVTGCHMANFTCLAAARHEVLRRAGGTLKDIVSMTVYVSDARYSKRFTDLRRKYYPKDFPASALVTAAGFALPEIMLEIVAIAVVD